jgi:hypothetical protein
MKKSSSIDEAKVFPGALKLTVVAIAAITMTGCFGSGGSSNVKPNAAAITPAVATSATGMAPTGGATSGTAPTAAAVIVAAGTEPSVAAGTAAAITPAQVTAGGTAGTQGIAGLSVSMPLTIDHATGKASIGAVTIDPTFSLAVTGSIDNGTVTSLTVNSANATTTGSSLTITQDTENTVNSTAGHTIATNTPIATNVVVMQAAMDPGYSYTQFGDWYQCSTNCVYPATGTLTAATGFFVRGEATAPANIPTTGTATYIGDSHGVGIDATGNLSDVYADMTAIANFAARNLFFATTNTEAQPFGSTGYVANSNLNMTGTLTYAAGQNLFAGTVTVAGTGANAMSGTATGRFYGPAAQEIGGVFGLSGAGGGYVGGFVGKQATP